MSPRILVIRFGSLGDLILCSSPILNLRISFPGAHIVLLTKQRFRETAELIPGVDDILLVPDHASAVELGRTIYQLEQQNFTHVVDLHGNFRSYLTRKLTSGAIAAVYPKRRVERKLIVTTKQYPSVWPHTIDLYNTAVEEIGGRAWGQRPVLKVSALAKEDASLVTGHRTVLIAPGAAHPTKQWPMERFATTARHLHDHHGYRLLWATTTSDPSPESLDLRGTVTELRDYSIPRLASIIALCRVVLANDSGLMHLASAVGTPVIALFGPTHPTLGFAPRGLYDQIIQTDEPCRPCSLHGKALCYRTEQFCFTRIEASTVAAAVCHQVESSANTRRALFIDRDGTLIVDKHYLKDPSGVELIPGAADALKKAQAQGYALIVLSNQSGVARGYFTEENVRAVNARLNDLLAKAGVYLDDVLYCPHYENGEQARYAVRCDCRKPSPGMAERAALTHGIDLRRSVVIGDKLDDLHLADLIGARGLLVRTGHGTTTEAALAESPFHRQKTVCDSLVEAVQGVL